MIDPFERFGLLLDRAIRDGLPEPTAMSLATVDENGQPSVRMVLLKDFDPSGFVFYTNLESRKARELAANPRAALCFHWQPFHAQVRVEGTVTRVSATEADAYFASRPRGSQIGAWASDQSRPLHSFAALDDRVAGLDRKFADKEVPRPEHWSGFRLFPERIEFWSGKPNRLHERELFTRHRENGVWVVELLYP